MVGWLLLTLDLLVRKVGNKIIITVFFRGVDLRKHQREGYPEAKWDNPVQNCH